MAALVAAPVQAATYQARVSIPGCSVDANGSETVPAGTDVVVTTSWLTKTRSELTAYLKYVKLTVSVNSVTVPNVKSYWGERYFNTAGQDKGWEITWTYSAGVIGKNASMVVQAKYVQTKTLSDGWNTYPPSKQTDVCTVIG